MGKGKGKQTIAKEYNKKQRDIARMMQRIQAKLEKDRKNEINWARVGSLTHVEELLHEIDEFLG